MAGLLKNSITKVIQSRLYAEVVSVRQANNQQLTDFLDKNQLSYRVLMIQVIIKFYRHQSLLNHAISVYDLFLI